MKIHPILFWLLIFALSSCDTAQRVQNRCARKARAAIALGCIKQDTVTLRDTIKGFAIDTVFTSHDSVRVDTFTVIKDGVRVNTVVKWKERIIEQQVTKRDTVKITQFVKTSAKIPDPKPCRWWVFLLIGAGSMLVLRAVVKSLIS